VKALKELKNDILKDIEFDLLNDIDFDLLNNIEYALDENFSYEKERITILFKNLFDSMEPVDCSIESNRIACLNIYNALGLVVPGFQVDGN
jgi:hypothetical protein